MPRIRTLKPEHKGHRKVGRLSDRAYRLWVGLITEADDEGRIVCDLGHFLATIFPFSGLKRSALGPALSRLLALGLVVRYEVGPESYLYFPSWHEHQRIDKPRRSTLPAPPERPAPIPRMVVESSSTPRDISIDRSNDRPTDPQPEGFSATRIGSLNGPEAMAAILARQKVLRKVKGYDPA